MQTDQWSLARPPGRHWSNRWLRMQIEWWVIRKSNDGLFIDVRSVAAIWIVDSLVLFATYAERMPWRIQVNWTSGNMSRRLTLSARLYTCSWIVCRPDIVLYRILQLNWLVATPSSYMLLLSPCTYLYHRTIHHLHEMQHIIVYIW